MRCAIRNGVEAVALFGSAARRDHDVLSDRDLLIVAEHSDVVNRACESLDRFGWSCTPYTWRRLQNSISSGSLFTIHLRNEAIILKDDSQRLRDTFATCKPRPAGYGVECREACSLIEALEYLPIDRVGRAWALDVLMVGFRSAAIALLADEGAYVFSFDQILAHMLRLGLLTNSDADLLRTLRQFKAAYRSNLGPEVPAFDDVRWLIDATSKCFGIGVHVRPMPDGGDIQRLFYDREHTDWYRRARLTELAVLRLVPRGSDAEEFFSAKHAILRLLRKPTQYGGLLKWSWPVVSEKVSQLHSYSIM